MPLFRAASRRSSGSERAAGNAQRNASNSGSANRSHSKSLSAACRLATDEAVSSLAYEAAQSFIERERGGRVRVVRGLVLSGDQFMKPAQLEDLSRRFPDGLAVEMEGAAVAQVCIEAEIPYAVVVVETDEGVRVVANLRGARPEVLRLGLPVEVVFETVDGELTLPMFRPRDASA